MRVELSFQGARELEAALQRLAQETPDECVAALRAEAEVEMTEAKKRTPVDTGALKASGHVQTLEAEGGGAYAVQLGFGGPAGAGNQDETNPVDVGYAIHVHENLEAFHPTGQAKFLESVLVEAAPHLPGRVLTRMLKRWRRGT